MQNYFVYVHKALVCALDLSEIKIDDFFPQGPYRVTGERARMSIIIHKNDALVNPENEPLTNCAPEIQPTKSKI